MFDLQNERVCPHQIFDEQLTLQGTSPNFFSILRFGNNLNTSAAQLQIREFASTNSLTNYLYTINGFTNWTSSVDGRQINFNTSGLGGPGTGVASFADGSTLINPQRIYLATYLTLPQNCPMHNEVALPVAGQPTSSIPVQKDINITPQGGFALVTGHERVRQAVLKALQTLRGDNTFYPTYGSTVSGIIGQKFNLFSQFSLQQSITNTVNFLILQQQLNPTIPLAETILKVASVNVSQDPVDPRTIQIVIQIVVGDFTTVPIIFGILTP